MQHHDANSATTAAPGVVSADSAGTHGAGVQGLEHSLHKRALLLRAMAKVTHGGMDTLRRCAGISLSNLEKIANPYHEKGGRLLDAWFDVFPEQARTIWRAMRQEGELHGPHGRTIEQHELRLAELVGQLISAGKIEPQKLLQTATRLASEAEATVRDLQDGSGT